MDQRIDRRGRWLAPVQKSVLGHTFKSCSAFFCNPATDAILSKHHNLKAGQREFLESEFLHPIDGLRTIAMALLRLPDPVTPGDLRRYVAANLIRGPRACYSAPSSLRRACIGAAPPSASMITRSPGSAHSRAAENEAISSS